MYAEIVILAMLRQRPQHEGKPNRHLYHLTERGIELLHASLCEFPPEQTANEAEFFTRVAFFEFLEPQEREVILKKRLAFLQTGLEYLQQLQQMAEQGDCAADMGICQGRWNHEPIWNWPPW